jgi:hypothetical protein
VVQRCTGTSCTTFNNVRIVSSTTTAAQGTAYIANDTLSQPGSFRYRVVACTVGMACSSPSSAYAVSFK